MEFVIPKRVAAMCLCIMQCVVAVLLSGCNAPVIEHYHRFAKLSPERRPKIKGSVVTIIETEVLETQMGELRLQGYELLGVSCFIDVDIGKRMEGIRELAKKEEAEIIVTWQAPMNAAHLNTPPSIEPRKGRESFNTVQVPLPMKMYCAFPMSLRRFASPQA